LINKLFSKKILEVEVRDIGTNIVDRSLFDANEFNNILANGLEIRGIQLIHHSLIHYSTKFRNSNTARVVNAFLDIFHNIDITQSNQLVLNSDEGSEFQSKSTEVIAVGLSIFLTTKLFKIKRNQINSIEVSGKRCDFRFEKSNLEYLIESKGRKGSISEAISDIFLKKTNSAVNSPKYGVISKLPRDGNPAKIVIIDPPYEASGITKKIIIQNLLYYYSNLTRLSGFWRLSDLLLKRYDDIKNSVFLESFDNVHLELGNVYKFGEVKNIKIENLEFEYFFSYGDNKGFNLEKDEMSVNISIDKKLLNILIEQDFDKLIEYKLNSNTLRYENKIISVNDDGSLLSFNLNL